MKEIRTSKCQVFSSNSTRMRKNFFRIFFEVSGKSHSAEKCKKDSVAKHQQIEGETDSLETLKKFAKKFSQRRNNLHKNFGKGRDSSPCPSPSRSQKILINLYAK